MKKYLLSLFAVGLTVMGAMAQETKPAAGLLNMEEDNAGLGNIEVMGSYSVNPECKEFAQLYQNGVLLKQVPAYAGSQLVYTCTDDKAPVGNLHITFYAHQAIEKNPAKQFGTYKVIIPEGFAYKIVAGKKQPMPRLERDFTINEPALSVFPTSGSTMQTLTKLYVTLPEQAGTVTYKKGTEALESGTREIYPYFTLADDTEVEAIEGKVTGRVIELTFPEITTAGRALITFPPKCFQFTVPSGPLQGTYWNPLQQASYSITGVQTGFAPTITPAPGTYEGGIKSAPTEQTFNINKDYCYYFVFTAPEDITNIYMANGAPELWSLKADGTRDSKVASLNMQKITDNKIGIFSQDNNLYRVESTLYPGPGKYELVIPQGKIYYSISNRNAEYSFGPFEFTQPSDGISCDITPSQTEELEGIQEITLTYPEDTKIVWNRTGYAVLSSPLTTIQLQPSNMVIEEGVATKYADIDGNVVKFNLPVTLKNAGEWNFSIGDDALQVNGNYSTVKANFTIQAPAKPTLEFSAMADNTTIDSSNFKVITSEDDEYGVEYHLIVSTYEDEATITFEIPEGFSTMYWQTMGTAMGNYRRYPTSEFVNAGWHQGNTITVENGTNSEMYQIAFAVGDDISDENMFRTFITVNSDVVTGVATVETTELVDVYSLTGVRVATKADSSVLNTLPAGLYIINGHKVLVK